MASPGESAAARRQKPKQAAPAKLPPLPKGTTIRHRPIPSRTPPTRASHRFYVKSSTPFRSITTRVRKQLVKNLRTSSSTHPQALTNKLSKKDMSLSSRIYALEQAQGSGIGLEHAGEVVVAGTGKAIEKVVNVAAFFKGQGDCEVTLRTGSVGAVDDVVQEGEDEEEMGWEDGSKTRVRMVSSLEVSIKLR
ncbi:Rpp20 subunit of nuclear RNase MRP and P-domain-containing protein [Pseudomassariella vexata]|uniref:Rpp20 subunit of nuclear RNase MRP and P-domain-containing protein n=1 Tax=Pseudomassariella vexata TaxID=1141098 RepID=A0A1Y2D7J0_9PEZI|nr:Rpp20 subunit of nuclear RNase MRP and P-domain-containing protein [Pseudomassariella vexata]ORY55239.1 Rpp20 subunit of nuclear RNase MRP and P-domain-containing protein [Pseudomassariella vexata]